jgi:UDP-glucose:(heptosyl)LPS alpha-1,3-glucosyltransferase
MPNIKFIRANKTKHGGAEVYLLRLSTQLKEKNIYHEIINSNIPKFLPSWFRVLLFNFQVCFGKMNDDIYFSLERISCPDIYRAGDGVHKKFVQIEKKSKLNPLHFVYQYIEKKTFNNAKKIIANSNMVKQEIIDIYGINSDKIEVIYNGVPIKPKVDFSDIKKEFDLTDEKVILYVGSGFARKGVKEALELVSQLKYDNFKFIIVGKEKKMSFYKDYTKSLGIEDRVIFTGARSDVDKFYSMSDIFLFSTRYEPFSNVVLEAMSYENVVFTTKQNGASEVLKKEFIMETSEDSNIVTIIDELLNNNEKLENLKLENLEIAKNFSIEKNVDNTLKVIKDLNVN